MLPKIDAGPGSSRVATIAVRANDLFRLAYKVKSKINANEISDFARGICEFSKS